MTTLEHLERYRRPTPTATERAGEAVADLAAGSRRRIGVMLISFWSGFWLLNGLDLLFNQPTFFGVAREAAFVSAFAQIGLPDPVALTAMYGMAVSQTGLGIAFIVALVSAPRLRGLMTLCLEASVAVLMVCAVGAILVGARSSLLEHSGYIGLVVLSMMFLRQAGGTRAENNHR